MFWTILNRLNGQILFNWAPRQGGAGTRPVGVGCEILAGTATLNAHLATQPSAASNWTVPFSNATGSFLFMTGDNGT